MSSSDMFTCVGKTGKAVDADKAIFTTMEAVQIAVKAIERIARVRGTGVCDARRDTRHDPFYIDAIGMAGEMALMKLLPSGAVMVEVEWSDMPSRRRRTDKGDIIYGDTCFEVKTSVRTGECMHLIIPPGFFTDEEMETGRMVECRAATTFCLVIVDLKSYDTHPVPVDVIRHSTFTIAGYISLDEAVKKYSASARSDGSIWIPEHVLSTKFR